MNETTLRNEKPLTFDERLLGKAFSPRRYLSGMVVIVTVLLVLLALVLKGTYWLAAMVLAGFWLGLMMSLVGIVAIAAAIVVFFLATHSAIL